jgi:hypothetical protein
MENRKIFIEWLFNNGYITEALHESEIINKIEEEYSKVEKDLLKNEELLIINHLILDMMEISNKKERIKISRYIDNHTSLSVMNAAFNIDNFEMEQYALNISLKVLKFLKGNYNIVTAPNFQIDERIYKVSDYIVDIDVNEEIFNIGLKNNLELDNIIVKKMIDLFENKNPYIYFVIQSFVIDKENKKISVISRFCENKNNEYNYETNR